ncbi:MAG: TetR/AcrR family transcriptional regulator [Candidatus Marinimicrobia bacterium]|nr:TetR/AcrR family transcriptional regulator [Candidatus Neomarinimicrobiota bacterium]
MIDKFQEKKEKILDSAMEVFIKSGYSETRMDDIVNESGMSKGAIYYHYKSKKELFLALIEHWEIHAFPNFYDKNEIGISSSEILRSFSEEIADVFETRKYVFLAEVEIWAMANRDEDVKDKTQKLYQKILVLFEKVLNRGIKSGEFKNINPKIAAIAVLTSLQGVNWFCIFEYHEFSAREYLIEVMEFMIQGFKVKQK